MYGQFGCLFLLLATSLSPCESFIQLPVTSIELYFFSPNFPQNGLKQEWLLTARDPSNVIHLEIVDSEMAAAGSTCIFDFVQAYVEQSGSSIGNRFQKDPFPMRSSYYDCGGTVADPVIRRFCGTDAPSYVTSGSSMYILFSPDDTGSYMGFYMRYYSSSPVLITSQTSSLTQTPSLSTVTTLVIPQTTAVGESRAGESGLTTTSVVGILIAVAFCLIVFVAITASVCLHNANRVHAQPEKRPKGNEDERWQTIFKPRRPIPFNQESDLSSRSTTSSNMFNTSTTSGFSSGAPCSPSTLHPVIAQHHLADHHYHTLSPVPETTRSGTYDDTDGRYSPMSSQKQYAYLDMMELSPRRLQPLPVPNNASRISSPRSNKVSIAHGSSESDVTTTSKSDQAATGLPSALKKAREARRARIKQSKKTGEEFERGHAHTKHSLINRIDLVRCGVLTGEGTGVPRVDNDGSTRNPRHLQKSVSFEMNQ